MRPAGIPKASGILPCRIFVFHKLLLRPYKFWKGYLPTCHLLAQALTVERTVIVRPPSQCCQMCDMYPPDYTSNLATLSTLPPPLVALFTTAHDICMCKRCQNICAGSRAWCTS